ncbi:nucleotide-binding universal stress UspA family protein [Nitrobacter vulgaris]|uniref:universal stress protein n=1 Tax=Nitrobacter vulgaris TaxID=29421 RepID=UPI00285474EE|nr:universal stress protein [Nitrobacter vulgaris]MDR6302545.1 nucleotide-binding universal stress UspA family protein [Nitrobacter vulgaris]
MYAHILISTDGSELAQKGVDHGLSLADENASKVTIITVTEPFPVPSISAWGMEGMEPDRLKDTNTRHAQAILSAAQAAAEEMGLTVETLHISNTSPAAAIVDAAKTQGCDLIVMASHGYRGIKRVLLGSQTTEVIATAHIPVLVVH